MPNTSTTHLSAKVSALELSVSNLALEVSTFIKATAADRNELKEAQKEASITHKEETDKLWKAIIKQGDNMEKALSNAASRGELTIGKVIGVCVFLIGLVTSGVAINNAYMEKWIGGVNDRFAQYDIHRDYGERERESIKTLIKREFELADQESASRYTEQQTELDRLTATQDAAEIRLRETESSLASTIAKSDREFAWLRANDNTLREYIDDHSALPAHPSAVQEISELRGTIEANHHKQK